MSVLPKPGLPKSVRIVEVGPRDGLQYEDHAVVPEDRAKLVEMLADAGLKSIEVGAFVSEKKVPQMAGTDKVCALLEARPGVSYIALVPNLHGMEDAIKAGLHEVAVFAAASETFSRKNIDCSIDESLERFAPVMEEAKKHGMRVRGYVSCVLGCPYEGAVPHTAVERVTRALLDMGCYEVSLGDTIGVGKPGDTRTLLRRLKAAGLPVEKLAGHFHDTGGLALENIRAAMEEGVTVFDSSVAGLGGCPYAPGASGNVGTGEVVEMMRALGVETGIDPEKLAEAGRFIRAVLSRA